MFTVSLKHM